MQRYNAFLITQKLGLSRRMCHEEYGNYSETHGDHTLHEDARPAWRRLVEMPRERQVDLPL
jgi:hypothetical protein